jgi:Cu-Zn family superoxide dismutase
MRRDPQVVIGPPGRVAKRVPRTGGDSLLRALVPLLVPVALAACATDGAPPRPSLGAKLVPTGGSAMGGGVAFGEVDGGLMIAANVTNGTPGAWRVAIHANGNCSSANGFSAGPPVLLPGSSLPAVVGLTLNENGIGGISTRLPGLRLDGPNGIVGKSVVVHAGAIGSLEAVPGVPNSRAACGVIGPVVPLF